MALPLPEGLERLRASSQPTFGVRPILLAALLLALGVAPGLIAREPGEYQVKAAFLLNFARFVEWPPHAYASPQSPLVIGVLGEDPFGESLRLIVQGQTAQGRPIEIRHFRDLPEAPDCHVLFVTRSVTPQLPEVLNRVRGRPILTVGETDDFVRRGGMIGFAVVDESVRFDMRPRVTEEAGLKASSKLLVVARSLRES